MVLRRWAYLLLAALMAGCSIEPLPLTDPELDSAGLEWSVRAAADHERISRPLSLYEAMARALKYNLSARTEALEAAYMLRKLDLASADQLPQLVAGLDFSGRNNVNASSSVSVLTWQQSLEPSTSSDRMDAASNLNLSWNILDFGLSYVRAHQTADNALIAAEKRRKALHTLLQDVRTAFWKTAAAELLAQRLKGLSARMSAANEHVRALESQDGVSPLFTLTYRREALELQIEIQRLYAELSPAKVQLAALMNVRPNSPFVVSAPRKPVALPHALPSFGTMSKAALQKRPEIREAGYNVRINQREAQVALLELLPGIGPLLTANTDTNSYLYNPNWVTAGAKASWNLMKIFAYPQRRAAVDAEAAYLDEKALATAVAIMTEVEVARVNYLQSQERFRIAQELYDVETSILKQMSSSQEAGSIGDHILLRQELRALLAEAKKDLAYAEYQNAFGMLFVSLGMDFTQDAIDGDRSLVALSAALESDWRLKCKQALKSEAQ